MTPREKLAATLGSVGMELPGEGAFSVIASSPETYTAEIRSYTGNCRRCFGTITHIFDPPMVLELPRGEEPFLRLLCAECGRA